RIEERFHSRGGPAYAYRLRVERPLAPDFQLRLVAEAPTGLVAGALALVRGGEAKLKILAERVGGFKEPIQLKIDGLPQGVAASGLTIPAQHAAPSIVLQDTPAVRVAAYRLAVRGPA